MKIDEYPLITRGPQPGGRYLIEASAGTGKTYTIAHLVKRLILDRVPAREILVTTFSKPAAAELKARILKVLNASLNELRPRPEDTGSDPGPENDRPTGELRSGGEEAPAPESPDEAEKSSRMLLLMQAIGSIDEMTVSTIHGFCKRMLGEYVLDSGLGFELELIPDESSYTDRLVRAFCRGKYYDGAGNPNLNFESCRKAAKLAGEVVDECPEPASGPSPEQEAYLYVRDRLQAEKEKDGAVSFDDLIRIFSEALDRNPGLAKRIQTRFRAVFVDEFQDTDRIQFSIFDRCFPADGSTIFYMIGDPKQAIYGFRGADIYAYLQAKRTVREPFSMTENYRSSHDMIRAVNLMFGDGRLDPSCPSRAVFMQDGIPFIPVTSGRKPEDFPQDTGPCLRLSRYEGKKDACEPVIERDVVRDIRRLLSTACNMQVFEKIEKNGKEETVPRPLRASDIAILVQTHDQASDFVRLLNREGIAASACKSGSIYFSDEAKVMLLLLKTFLHPDMQSARGIMLSPFFRCSCEEIVSDSVRSEVVMKRLADCGAVWRTSGLPAAFLGFMDTPTPGRGNLTPRERILSESGGERALTNYLHLMELLYQKETEEHFQPEDVLNSLNLAIRGQISDRGTVSTDDAEENPDQLRLDRDSASVQILTMFAAKGLEFPVVFVPFPAKTDISQLVRGDVAYKVNAAATGGEPHITLDFGKSAGNKRILQEEALRSAVRLLYVAMTRATLVTYLYVQQLPLEEKKAKRGGSPPINFVKSAQGVLLRDKRLPDDGTPESIRAWKDYFFNTKDKRPDVCAEWYDALFDPSPDAGAADPPGHRIFELIRDRGAADGAREEDAIPPLRTETQEEAAMEALTAPSVSDDWRVMSFSAFQTMLTGSVYTETETPADYDSADVPDVPSGEDDSPVIPAAAPVNSFRDFPRGKNAGTLTHSILEQFATTRPPGAGPDISCYFNLFAEENDAGRRLVMDRIGDALEKHAFRPENGRSMYDGISYALRTPLPGIGVPLCDIRRSRMTAEFEFFLDASSSLDLQSILSVLRADASALAGKYLPEYRPSASDKHGFLNGIVDLIFEHGGKYYVVDWKTNWLGKSDDDYAPDRVAAEMGGAGYILQSYLYSAGLLRILRQRGIRDDAFGGVFYLFLRGLDGHSANGIWRDVPPLVCLENLLKLFQGDRCK